MREQKTVERAKSKKAKSLKSRETKIINRYQEKKMVCTHFKTWWCVKNSVREKKTCNRTNDVGGRN